MQEKTSIEKIDEMYAIILQLEKKIAIIDNNIKILNSKANGELLSGLKDRVPVISVPKVREQVITDLDAKPTIGVPEPSITDFENDEFSDRKTTVVQGKILAEDGSPMPSVEVKVISHANKSIVAETRTNKAGLWTKFLGPGKYIIKYVYDNQPNQFRMIDVQKGQEKLTVQ